MAGFWFPAMVGFHGFRSAGGGDVRAAERGPRPGPPLELSEELDLRACGRHAEGHGSPAPWAWSLVGNWVWVATLV